MRAINTAGIILLVLICTAIAQSPPAFPWDGSATTIFFKDALSGRPVESRCITIEIMGEGGPHSTTLRSGPDGRAILYSELPSGSSASASATVHCSGSAMEYAPPQGGQAISIGSANELALIPVGLASGKIISSNGSGVPAQVEFKCSQKNASTHEIRAEQDGAFSAVLPAGNCSAFAHFNGETGSAEIAITRGKESQATIQLGERGGIMRLADDSSAYIILALLVLFGAAIIYWKEKGKKKTKKGKAALLLLLAFAASASAATVSITRTDSTHTYDLQALMGYVPNAQEAKITVTGGSIDGCLGRTIVEVSDDGANYATLGTISTVSPQPASIILQFPGARRHYRLRNGECWLTSSRIEIHERPDLAITSIALRAEDGTSIPRNNVPITVVATISNSGGALNASRISSATVHFYQDSRTPSQKLGEVRIQKNSSMFNEKGSDQAAIAWAPPSTGMHTIHAELIVLPEGEEADLRNNIASRGFYVEPALTDQRSSALIVVSDPPALATGANISLRITASYTDVLTRQPILGATCTTESPRISGGPVAMGGKGAAYESIVSADGLGVGVYTITASCSKPGHAQEGALYHLPVNSPGGQYMILAAQPTGPHFAETVFKKAEMGPIQQFKIRIERIGPEAIGVTNRSVMINGFHASSFSTDGRQRDGQAWLEGNASYAEWVFGSDRIIADTLSTSISATVSANATHSGSISAYLVATPVQSFCSRRAAQVSIVPQRQVGEIGTPLYYEIILNNTNNPECGPARFTADVFDPRQGWRYEFSSSIVPVVAGESNVTFLSVTPLPGEQPGEYFFTVEISQEPESAQDAPPKSHARAAYVVSSARLFAGLDAGISGNAEITALPGATADFFARYYDLGNRTIGSCRIFSQLVSTKGVAMPVSGGTAMLSADVAGVSPGTYPYMITCESEGHKSLSRTGNATILPTPGATRLPSISVSPASVAASPGASFTQAITAKSNSECEGEETIILAVAPPTGWEARLSNDALSVPCNGEGTAFITIKSPESAPEGIWFATASAHVAGAPEFASEFRISIATMSGPVQVPLSCMAGNARESEANMLMSGDACRNWNEWHTYEITPGHGAVVRAAGIAEFEECQSPAYLEFGSDPASFTRAAQAIPNSAGEFNLSSTANGSRFVRIRSECLLKATSLSTIPEIAAQPDFIVTSAEFPEALFAGQPATANATVFNLGPSTYSQYSVSIGLLDAYGSTTTVGVGQVYSHASGQGVQVEISFIPQEAGTFTLVFTADSAREIGEANESNNVLLVHGATVSPAPADEFTARLQPGWNLVPFLSGSEVSSNCSGSAHLLLSGRSTAKLSADSLGFASEEEAVSFAEAHGTAASPKDILALGSAWLYSEDACEIRYSAKNATLHSRSAASKVRVPAGGVSVAVLPWMAGSTVQNILGTCAPANTYAWDPGSQKWLEFSGAVSNEMVGSALAVQSTRECRLG